MSNVKVLYNSLYNAAAYIPTKHLKHLNEWNLLIP